MKRYELKPGTLFRYVDCPTLLFWVEEEGKSCPRNAVKSHAGTKAGDDVEVVGSTADAPARRKDDVSKVSMYPPLAWQMDSSPAPAVPLCLDSSAAIEAFRVPRRAKKVYLMGSLRNPEVTKVAAALRALGLDVFDDWMAAGPEADDHWQKYETARGRNFREALKGHAAQHVFHYDKKHLDESDEGVLVMPAGKSGHMELTYLVGKGKPAHILMTGEPDRFDVMYNFASNIFLSLEELVAHYGG